MVSEPDMVTIENHLNEHRLQSENPQVLDSTSSLTIDTIPL